MSRDPGVTRVGRVRRTFVLSVAGSLVSLLFLAVVPPASMASAAGFVWLDQFGSSGQDAVVGVAVDGTNLYVAGWAFEALPGQTHMGLSDAYVRKYDFDGGVVWTRQFGTPGYDDAIRVAVNPSGVYVVGRTTGSLAGGNLGDYDAFIRKYDFDGTPLWTKQFGTMWYDIASGVTTDSANVYVAGGVGGALPGQAPIGGQDAFVRKYTSLGVTSWTSQFGTDESDTAWGVDAATDGVYVAGSTLGEFPGQATAGAEDAFVKKYTAAGGGLWLDQFGSSGMDRAEDVAADGTAAYVAGHAGDSLPGKTSAGLDDAFVRKYLAGGSEDWTDQFGTSADDLAFGIDVTNTRGPYVVGSTHGALSGPSFGGEDAFSRRYESGGAVQWTTQFGTVVDDMVLGVAATDTVGIFLGGRTYGVFPGEMGAGNEDAYAGRMAETPNAPLNLVAAPGKRQVTLDWDPPVSDGGSAITNYWVYRDGSPVILLGNVLTYTDTGLAAGRPYCYHVSAVNAVGEGPGSNEACATPTADIIRERGVEWSGASDTAANGVFAADVDNDGFTEVLTAGETVGPAGLRKAQLRIWDAETLALEAEWVWPPDANVSFLNDVIARNVDADPEWEIIAVGGTAVVGYLPIGMVCFFTWDTVTLTYTGCISNFLMGGGSLYSVTSADLGGGPGVEWIAVGQRTGAGLPEAYIQFATWGPDPMPIADFVSWSPASEAAARGVFATNVDGDPRVEILTVGYTRPQAAPYRFGQLRVWDWLGYGNFQFQESVWQMSPSGSTESYSVNARDLNGDATVDILTCGYGFDGTRDTGELRRYDDASGLVFRAATSWWDPSGGAARCASVKAADLDGDSTPEIITAGWTARLDGTYAELRLYTFAFAVKATMAWRDYSWGWGMDTDAMVNAVFAGDVDRDGIVEIVSGGQIRAAFAAPWDAQLMIWYDP